MVNHRIALILLGCALNSSLTYGGIIAVSFEAQVTSPTWSDAFPFRAGQVVTGSFGLRADWGILGAINIESPMIYADGIGLENAKLPVNVALVFNDKRMYPSTSEEDEIWILIGAASLFRQTQSSSGGIGVTDDFSQSTGYGVYLRLRGLPGWIEPTDNFRQILGSASEYQMVEARIEYNYGGFSYYSDLQIEKIVASPEPCGGFMFAIASTMLVACRRARLG